jgi:prepilin-type processing-associated H-X9-DG protein
MERSHLQRTRGDLSLIDVLVMIAIAVLVIGVSVPMLQRSRGVAAHRRCADNLRQLGMAMLKYESANGTFPPGLFPAPVLAAYPPAPLPGTDFVPHPDDLQYGYYSGFSAVLPYMEHVNLGRQMNLNRRWFEGGDAGNAGLVAYQVRAFLCPSNRAKDVVDLSALSLAFCTDCSEEVLAEALPDMGALDYLLCKGANAALSADPSFIPAQARGIFDVGSGCARAEITRGSSNVFLIGEGAGNTPLYAARRNYTDVTAALGPGQSPLEPIQIDQGWGQGFVQSGRMLAVTNYCYGSVLGVTAQCGGFPGYGPFDEPLNGTPWLGNPIYPGSQLLITAAVDYNQGRDNGPAVTPFDTLSGFRSAHPGGAQFCFADGSVRFIQQDIEPEAYHALSTRAGAVDQNK